MSCDDALRFHLEVIKIRGESMEIRFALEELLKNFRPTRPNNNEI